MSAPRKYTDSQRAEALALYETHGPAAVQKQLGIPKNTVVQVARHAWSVKRKHGLAAVVVDCLGLLEGRPGQKEYEVVTEASRKLKLLAQALGAPVIALSQLNRGSESREGKIPQMSDLRSSGAAEQDTDVVIILHREIMEPPTK